MKNLTSILPKVAQYSSIEYVKDYLCPNCSKSGVPDPSFTIEKPNLIGWCESGLGLMVVVECPFCLTKFRFHMSSHRFNRDFFENEVIMYMLGRGNFNLAWARNAEVIFKQLTI